MFFGELTGGVIAVIYAIADLHLSFAQNKPMDVFGPVWRNHAERLRENWIEVVKKDDLVIIPGDISWAMRAEDVKVDLEWIGELPGTKLLIKGNHDYWWSTMSKARELMPARSYALLGDMFLWQEMVIVGLRGWVCPGDTAFSAKKDYRIYQRECDRLKKVLRKASKVKAKELIVAMHYPPFNHLKEPSGFTRLMERWAVDLCVYGHLHDYALKYVYDGVLDGVEYRCVSADKLLFKPEPCLPIRTDRKELLRPTFSI